MIMLIVAVFSTATAIIATMLILSKDYEDGVMGRLALALLAIAAYTTIFRGVDWIIAGMPPRLPFVPVGALVWSGMGIFLIRHYFRWRKFTRTRPHPMRRSGDRPKAAK